MTDDNRKKKKKRGRSKILRFCFRSTTGDGPSSSSPPHHKSDANRNDAAGRLGAVNGRRGRDFIPEVDLVNGGCDNHDDDDDDCCSKRSTTSSRRRISRMLKAVLFNAKLKKVRTSSSKSSICSDTSSSPLSTEKVDKSFNDGNAYARGCPEMDDSVSCSRRSNLFSSSSRTTSSAYSTSSRTTSSAYSSSSLSSTNSNSNSGSTSNQKTSSRIDTILDFGHHPVSSNSSALKKSNPINSNYYSSSCFDQRVSLSKSTPIHSISPSVSHQKGSLSRLNSTDSSTSVSSNVFLLMNSNPEKVIFGGGNWNIRWCLFLLLSLFVLTVWGRIFSIVCTSIWLYFVPCRRMKRVDSAGSMTEVVDTDSKHYKKRVIMAGLLERTRNPIR